MLLKHYKGKYQRFTVFELNEVKKNKKYNFFYCKTIHFQNGFQAAATKIIMGIKRNISFQAIILLYLSIFVNTQLNLTMELETLDIKGILFISDLFYHHKIQNKTK